MSKQAAPAPSSPARHTPGPWFVDRLNGPTETHRPMLCVVTRDVTIAELDVDGGPSQDVRNANAALIAAAPDLLEACHALLTAYNEQTTPTHMEWRAIEAAIAKAEG